MDDTDTERDFAQAELDAVIEAATIAVERGDLAAAEDVLAGEPRLPEITRVLRAIRAGDPELAFARGGRVRLVSRRLDRSLHDRIAADLARGTWEQRVLSCIAYHRARSADEHAGDMDASVAEMFVRLEAWAQAVGVPESVNRSWIEELVVVPFALRRRADDVAFETLAASCTGALDPLLMPAAWTRAVEACATRLVRAGLAPEGEDDVFGTYAIAAMRDGRAAGVRAEYEARVGGRLRPRHERHLGTWARRAEKLHAGDPIHTTAPLSPSRAASLERVPVGVFELTSCALVISDPCYALAYGAGASLQHTEWTAVPGRWQVELWVSRAAHAGSRRVAYLVASHAAHAAALSAQAWRVASEIGVDSGSAGIFDAAHFRDEAAVAGEDVPVFNGESRWFDLCAARTLGPQQGGVIPFGAVASSGLGDGVYSVLVARADDGVVGVCVDFALP